MARRSTPRAAHVAIVGEPVRPRWPRPAVPRAPAPPLTEAAAPRLPAAREQEVQVWAAQLPGARVEASQPGAQARASEPAPVRPAPAARGDRVRRPAAGRAANVCR